VIVKIVDASAIAAIVFGEPGSARIEAEIAGHRLAAPSLLPFEIGNVCLKKLRAHPDRSESILAGFARYADIPIDLHACDPASVVEAARATGLSAYDASYLLLAAQLSAKLVTLDEKLGKAAARLST
jgi:predicted nucleic acid-binding protein